MPNTSNIKIIAWKKLSRRTELLGKALHAELWFYKDNLPYARAALKTLINVIGQKPKIIIIQIPQGPLLLEAYLLKKLLGCKIVADVHTGFLVNTDWKGVLLNAPFVKLLPTANIIIAHNEAQLSLIPPKVRNKTIVVYDPWHLIRDKDSSIENNQERQEKKENYIVFPASFASDEPLEEVINTINTFNINVKMYITGNWKRRPNIKKYSSERVIFTGFLPNQEFNELLANATAIITGTKREYTTLMSGWEAVAYCKPLAVTATKTLKIPFKDYAIFYDWKNEKSIAEGIREILASKPNVAIYKELRKRTINQLKTLNEKLKKLNAA